MTLYPWIKALPHHQRDRVDGGAALSAAAFRLSRRSAAGLRAAETFKVMERRLLRGIMNPAMVATYVFGRGSAAMPGVVDWRAGWIYVKLAAVLALTVIHHRSGAAGAGTSPPTATARPARFYRIVNEVPTLLLIVIVIMVVVRPF